MEICDIISKLKTVKPGHKLWFDNERFPYKVRVRNERFLICTKPYNPKRTVLYTIIDLERKICGTENLVFCFGFESTRDCKEALQRLSSGETEISHRNYVGIDIITKINE